MTTKWDVTVNVQGTGLNSLNIETQVQSDPRGSRMGKLESLTENQIGPLFAHFLPFPNRSTSIDSVKTRVSKGMFQLNTLGSAVHSRSQI